MSHLHRQQQSLHSVPYPHITLLLFMIVLFSRHLTDKSNFHIQFGPFHFCLDWDVSLTHTQHTHTHTHTHTQNNYDAHLSLTLFKSLQVKKTAGVRNQLQSYLIQVIRKQCSDCYVLTPSFLRPGMFLCHGNPAKTTYRSTLVNPFPTTTTTAARLVGIIQSWVSTNPSFILDDLLVRVPTHISLYFPHTSHYSSPTHLTTVPHTSHYSSPTHLTIVPPHIPLQLPTHISL